MSIQLCNCTKNISKNPTKLFENSFLNSFVFFNLTFTMLRNFKKFLFLENIVRNFSPFLFVNNGFHGYCLTFAPNMLLDSRSANEVLFITINLIYFSNNQAVIKIITLPILLSLFFVFFFFIVVSGSSRTFALIISALLSFISFQADNIHGSWSF